MTIGETMHGFCLERIENVSGLHSQAYIFTHEKSGARLFYLKNDDVEKTFSIGFKTIPEDNTGVFHILEHSVLCGSDKFPVKEPFVDLLKGSMQTFLNAMTFPDKTMYPLASTNEKDFMNLMKVYMDAVLHPRIYSKPEIFWQEGWHLEAPEEGEPFYNGVVFNEMKGAMSSPDSMMIKLINSAMFPDNTYGFNSGGDPSYIPDLTYEQFLDQHRKYYHPENSFIFLSGDMDLESKLAFLDDEYLSEYTRQGNQFDIEMQKPLGFVRTDTNISIGENEDEKENGLTGASFILGTFADREENLAADLILETIADTNDSPLKKAMMDSGLGKDFSAFVYDGVKQTYVIFGLRKTDPENAEKFLELLRDTVRDICQKGIDREALTACLNSREFAARENDPGHARGVGYAISIMEGWLYGGDPVPYLSTLDIIASIREKLNTDWPEKLLSRIVLESEHSVLAVLHPSKTVAAEKIAAEKERAAKEKAGLDEAGLSLLRVNNEALKVFQTAEDTLEAKATLPKLELSDLNRTVQAGIPTVTDFVGGTKVIYHNVDTNGIYYVNYYFDIASLGDAEKSAASLICRLLTNIASENHSALELTTEIKSKLGELSFSATDYNNYDSDTHHQFLVAHASALESNGTVIPAVVEEVAAKTLYDPEEVKMLLAQIINQMERGMISSGTSYAVMRARAALRETSRFTDLTNGYGFLEYLRSAMENYGDGADFCRGLKQLAERIFDRGALTVSITCGDEMYRKFAEYDLPKFCENEGNAPQPPVSDTEISRKHAIRIPAEVAFDAKVYDFGCDDEFDFGLNILPTILTYDYLWSAIRVRGGAYGTNFLVGEDRLMTFCSFRDPNVAKTLETFDATVSYLKEFDADEEAMTRYIIASIAPTDSPMTPKKKSAVGDLRYFSGLTRQKRQKNRDRLMSMSAADVRGYGDVLASAHDSAYCVVAASEKIDSALELFDKITN